MTSNSGDAALKMSADEIVALLDSVFPQTAGRLTVLELEPYRLICTVAVSDADLRPGGTVSGPTLFAAADLAFYVLTLAMIGPKPLTVTTSTTINFMRNPDPAPIRAEARLLQLGRALSVGDVLLFSEGGDTPVAQASLTYSIPPNRAR